MAAGPVNQTLWAYWEGERTPYIDLCIETLQRWNPESLRLIGPEDLAELIGELPPEVAGQGVAHRADWLRFELLYRFGGMWVDCDFICCQRLAPLLALAECFDYVGHTEWDGGAMNNFMIARAGSPVMEACAQHALEVFRSRPPDAIHWYDPSRHALEAALAKYRWQAVWMNLPTHLIEPVTALDSSWFCSVPGPAEDPTDFTCFGFMTSNHTLRKHIARLAREELLGGERRISHLFRHALRQ